MSYSHCNINQQVEGNNNQVNQLIGNNQHNVFVQHPPQPEQHIIHRASITPIRIGDTPVKTWWFFVTGAVGLAAQVINVVDFLAKLNIGLHGVFGNALMYVTIASLILVLTAALLYSERYITLPFGHTIEADKQGNLYMTKISGVCGWCNEPVKVKTIGPKEHRRTRVICTNNPSLHQCTFDRTVLEDVGEDSRNRQGG